MPRHIFLPNTRISNGSTNIIYTILNIPTMYRTHKNIWHSKEHSIIGYFRYVDYTLIVHNDRDTNIQNVLKLFNNISPTLNFIIEHEVNNSINFLDLTIYKNQQFSFCVYRKPTATVIVIPHDSTPAWTKLGSHKILRKQDNNIPTRQQRQRYRMQYHQQILHNNKFNPNILDKTIERQLSHTKKTTTLENGLGKEVLSKQIVSHTYALLD